jgi:hypothetical protein
MKKLMVSMFAFAALTSTAMAGEALTTSQLDQVTAGGWGSQFASVSNYQNNSNRTYQSAKADGGCNGFAFCHGGANGNASAQNNNATYQSNSAINAAVNVD